MTEVLEAKVSLVSPEGAAAHECEDPFDPADRLMHQAVAQGVFPGAVLLVARQREVLVHRTYGVADLASGRRVTRDTVFDLASLTKPLATTLALIRLMADGLLVADSALEDLLPRFKGRSAARVTVEQLLRHRSGLPAWYPYFERLRKMPGDHRREALHEWLCATELENPPGVQTVYSDLNFLILGWIVETLGEMRLDRFVGQRIYRPLAVKPLFFIPLDEASPALSYAATERCPWRGTLTGQVHDDNCWTLGGVCGHAGLFGTAGAVHRLMVFLLDAFRGNTAARVLSPDWVRVFLELPRDGWRPMGFDRPSGEAPSCGRYFSCRTVGHLGFTGTSVWMDLQEGIIVILLTNRVHPTRRNEAIRLFRPRLHDAVMQTLAADISLVRRPHFC